MEYHQLYAIILGGVFLLLFLIRLMVGRLLRLFQLPVFYFLFKHIVYPYAYRRRSFLPPATRGGLVLQVTYWSISLAFNFVRVSSVAEIGLRTARLSVINLAPLLLSGRLSLIADCLGISLQSYQQIHRSIGTMTILQALAHVLILVYQKQILVHDSSQFFGLLVRTLEITSLQY